MTLTRASSPAILQRRLLRKTLVPGGFIIAGLAATLPGSHPRHVHAAASPSSLADPAQAIDILTPAAGRKPAPDFTLVDNHGKSITLSQYKGKVVLLDFWATWCGGCKLEIPWYMDFDRRYRDSGLAVIGV